jgi:SAM-dependent methyltransferase
MSTLNKLGIDYNTDKTSEVHNYLVKYEKYLPFKRFDKLNFLEIGVLRGESIKMWSEYFYRSKIVGIDIKPQYESTDERIIIEVGSQADNVFLNDVMRDHGPFDMILDDGSHMNEHVIYSFEHLFESVKPGGVYVIEDIGTSYWDEWGGGYLRENTSMEYFKKLSDDINFRGLQNFNTSNVHGRREDWLIDLSNQTQPDCRTDIESITFLNGIIIITKR